MYSAFQYFDGLSFGLHFVLISHTMYFSQFNQILFQVWIFGPRIYTFFMKVSNVLLSFASINFDRFYTDSLHFIRAIL